MSRKKVYFDNNIYGDIIRDEIEVDKIKDILNRKKLALVISSLNLFESASCWKSSDPKGITTGMKHFQLFNDLLPCRFLKEDSEIVKGELATLMDNISYEIYYEGSEAIEEIKKLANGVYDDRARKYIDKKWKSKIVEIQNRADYFRQMGIKVQSVFKEFLSTHQQFLTEEIIGSRILNIPSRFKRRFARKIIQKSHRFPMINSLVKANLFLDFRLIKFGQMSHDTPTDVKHLILASYADVFVSNDVKLHKYYFEINDKIEMINLSDLMLS